MFVRGVIFTTLAVWHQHRLKLIMIFTEKLLSIRKITVVKLANSLRLPLRKNLNGKKLYCLTGQLKKKRNELLTKRLFKNNPQRNDRSYNTLKTLER